MASLIRPLPESDGGSYLRDNDCESDKENNRRHSCRNQEKDYEKEKRPTKRKYYDDDDEFGTWTPKLIFDREWPKARRNWFNLLERVAQTPPLVLDGTYDTPDSVGHESNEMSHGTNENSESANLKLWSEGVTDGPNRIRIIIT